MSAHCLTCGLRITSDLVGWSRVTEHGSLVGYTCPRCQPTDHSAHAANMVAIPLSEGARS